METWMISNRQPWPEALVRGLITSKTRSAAVHLPPVGSRVYLHASKALWKFWRGLGWVEYYKIDVPNLPRGGIVAVATLARVGPTSTTMPAADHRFFDVYEVGGGWCCAGEVTMVFKDVKPLTFIPCRGAQVPTRKLPEELLNALKEEG